MHGCLGGLGQVDESGVDLLDQRVADCVALVWAHQAQVSHGVGLADLQQIQRGQQAGDGFKHGAHQDCFCELPKI